MVFVYVKLSIIFVFLSIIFYGVLVHNFSAVLKVSKTKFFYFNVSSKDCEKKCERQQKRVQQRE